MQLRKIKRFLNKDLRFVWGFRHLKDWWYYIKCALWHKYNRIHVKTLSPTYHDTVELLPHAMFQVLEDFVKYECSPGIIDWDADPESKAARAKMDELLAWWKQYRETDLYADCDRSKTTPVKDMFHTVVDENGKVLRCQFTLNEYEKEFYKKVDEKEKQMEEELTKKLKELVDLRPYLWT